jgi:hypothetical protein
MLIVLAVRGLLRNLGKVFVLLARNGALVG